MRRWAAIGFSIAVLVAVVWPIGRPKARDSFPLSSYPMFARAPGSARLRMVYARGLTAAGTTRPIPPRDLGSSEVLHARAALERADRRGKAGRLELCREIAERLAARGGLPDVVAIEIVRGDHDAARYFETGELGQERRLGGCPVPGRGQAPQSPSPPPTHQQPPTPRPVAP